MTYFIILPNQLFDKKYLDKKYKYIIWEHPHYFTCYNYNKKKLVLHRSSMRYYLDYLKKAKFNVNYLEFDEKFNEKEYTMFDPVDKLDLKGKVEILDTPNFLISKEQMCEYRDKTDKFFFNGFYNWNKEQLDILPKIKSQDKMNRKRLPPDVVVPGIASNKSDEKFIKEAIRYVEKHFPDNYGNTDNFIYPVRHTTAKRWLTHFIKYKFEDFGDYQDFVKKDNGFMFHSLLSSSINIGLINPSEIIDKIMDCKKDIPMNSFEGYVRQLFWREYQRYCYVYYNFSNRNYFGNNKKLNKDWYEGTLGIEPVDNAIKEGFETGYLHHIQRLMVVGNFMNLSGIHPWEGLKWFMEFSCDAYEWVMYQNVLDMVFFVSGGATMRRPYISSSNYIIKMSDYKKGEWSDEWDCMYEDFLKKNKDKLWKFRYHFRGLKDV
uniref:Cryptochrome/DNA photolyase FAD-binding domain-containing protein n=1 Tax=viral metagenome TaxID=1070528 RepID=A0A6C0LJM0_9ZZZZ